MHTITGTDDLDALIRFSTALFERHGFGVDLPDALDPLSTESLVDAIANGYTDAIALPSAAWQHEHLSRLATTFASGAEWDSPHLDVDGAAPLGRPAGSYILLVRPDRADDDDLRGLTAPALRKRLGHDTCLTVGEYLVVQRTMFERHGDHRFDDYTGDPPGWMWVADSAIGERTAMAYWYGPTRRLEVTACKAGSKNPRTGARRSRVIPLG